MIGNLYYIKEYSQRYAETFSTQGKLLSFIQENDPPTTIINLPNIFNNMGGRISFTSNLNTPYNMLIVDIGEYKYIYEVLINDIRITHNGSATYIAEYAIDNWLTYSGKFSINGNIKYSKEILNSTTTLPYTGDLSKFFLDTPNEFLVHENQTFSNNYALGFVEGYFQYKDSTEKISYPTLFVVSVNTNWQGTIPSYDVEHNAQTIYKYMVDISKYNGREFQAGNRQAYFFFDNFKILKGIDAYEVERNIQYEDIDITNPFANAEFPWAINEVSINTTETSAYVPLWHKTVTQNVQAGKGIIRGIGYINDIIEVGQSFTIASYLFYSPKRVQIQYIINNQAIDITDSMLIYPPVESDVGAQARYTKSLSISMQKEINKLSYEYDYKGMWGDLGFGSAKIGIDSMFQSPYDNSNIETAQNRLGDLGISTIHKIYNRELLENKKNRTIDIQKNYLNKGFFGSARSVQGSIIPALCGIVGLYQLIDDSMIEYYNYYGYSQDFYISNVVDFTTYNGMFLQIKECVVKNNENIPKFALNEIKLILENGIKFI